MVLRLASGERLCSVAASYLPGTQGEIVFHMLHLVHEDARHEQCVA
jgi:hypothetical protein